MSNEIRRYYNGAKIFRFFRQHKYIYKTIFRDQLQKRLGVGNYIRPRNLVLKLHTGCNAKCRFCYAQNEAGHAEGALSKDDWKDIILQAKKLGCYTVTLSGGEPFIYPHLIELVEYVRKMRMISFTSTNGIAVTPEMLRELERAGLCSLNWSMHGPREAHDSVVGVPGAFDRIVEQGEFCATKTKIVCVINHVVTRESIANKWYAYLWDLMRPKGFRALSLLPVCVNTADKSDLLGENDLKVFDELAKLDYILMDTKNYTTPTCPAAKEDVLVNNFGEIQACPFIPIIFGNLKESSLKKIFLRMQRHPMFSVTRTVCMLARDHKFIDKYILPAFKSERIPPPVEEICGE